MQQEIDSLRAQLRELEQELEQAKGEFKDKEKENEQCIIAQKKKWDRKHRSIIHEIKDVQDQYETELKKFQEQMQGLADTLLALKKNTEIEEQEEQRFLKQIDAELIAIAGRTQMRSRDERISYEADTIHDEICDETARSETNSHLLSSIAKARELLRDIIDRGPRPSVIVPPLPSFSSPNVDIPDISKSLTESFRDASIYGKILFNDEILNSLTMSEREAVVYSLINAGSGVENRRDVQLEDLLNITHAEDRHLLSSAKFEDLSSIIEEESGCDSVPEPIGLTFSLAEVQAERSDFNRKLPDQIPNLSRISEDVENDYIHTYSEEAALYKSGEMDELNQAIIREGTMTDESGKIESRMLRFEDIP